MSTYDRRTFIKKSAMVTATAIAGRVFLPPFASSAAFNQSADHPFFVQTKNRPEVIAHRGGDGQWPGETMLAFKEATKIGVDVLEMDVYRTEDGQLALMHDAFINKTTDGHGLIHNSSLAELQELNAAYKWSRGENIHRNKKLKDIAVESRKGVRVPSLRDVFEAFPQTRMVIEMKPALRSPAEALCKLIREHGMMEKVLVASFWGGYMRKFRQLCPEVATSTSLSLGDLKRFIFGGTSLIDMSLGAHAVQAPYWIITESFVDLVKKRNLKLHAWTVDRVNHMNKMKALGVDGIITDYPCRLLSLLGRASQVECPPPA
jgi:glycerophosphoryl diester phosphodiesterase